MHRVVQSSNQSIDQVPIPNPPPSAVADRGGFFGVLG